MGAPHGVSEPNSHLINLKNDASRIVEALLVQIQSQNKDPQLTALIDTCLGVAKGQEEYISEASFPETNLQEIISKDTVTDARAGQWIGMLSGKVEGNFLKLLAETGQAKRILEIGMFTGYSAVTLAESAYCEEMISLELEPYYESFLKKRLAGTPLEKKVRIVVGPAQESLEILKTEGKQFDFVFIDANKSGYIDYYKFIMDNGLLSKTGVIACDNILWSARTYCQADKIGTVLHEFTEFVKKDERVYQVIVPIRDGILLIKPKPT